MIAAENMLEKQGKIQIRSALIDGRIAEASFSPSKATERCRDDPIPCPGIEAVSSGTESSTSHTKIQMDCRLSVTSSEGEPRRELCQHPGTEKLDFHHDADFDDLFGGNMEE